MRTTRRTRLTRWIAAASVGLLAATLAACSGGSWELEGDLATHDPALAVQDGTWYVYSTGNGTIANGNIQVRSSEDGRTWRYEGEVWETKPEWIREQVPGVDNLWAPELIEHGGTWYLYYSASTFGKNRSVIALATNTTLDPDDPQYEWVDQGPVISSTPLDDFNAIDPGVATDDDGTPYMAFGSFWSGIRMVELEWPSGLRVDDAEPLHLADRQEPPNAVEAPYLLEHEGEWFLFVSFDSCCRAADSTYRIAVGRADAPTGPFVDRDGVPLLAGGGTVLLETDGSRVGPGGQSVSDGVMAFHWYDADLNGQFRLGLAPVEWDADGWPVLSW
ncbi:arabinan endo-1,5-alpha-L-arabinosidase [Microbacterium thalassium]|uniref:Arabinan endo-1,5-alpha-L-arabinosidase n=1 Tax=Microbacterium thalassium TaxID=362649 RepID=A0A7X0KU59_9MICO|nr:arabinan endo-1,5-alpha-L-arabinosidase [Microbacterium thalassium]MBB6390826.1 arabinan endo-1,5-alpha-L-arabinosidase [Microbacterium thalassium]GLK25934.1 arabinan endo-1,5-alpha-L-arabinosidase [Microbacterium thalassium]